MGLFGSVLTKMAAHLAGSRIRVRAARANCLDRGGWGDRRSWWRGRPIGAGGLGWDALPYVKHQHLTECVHGASGQQHAAAAGYRVDRARKLAMGRIAALRMDGGVYAVGGRNHVGTRVQYGVRQTLTETIGSGVQERGASGIANYARVNNCSGAIENCATCYAAIEVDLGWRLVRTAHGNGSERPNIIVRRVRAYKTMNAGQAAIARALKEERQRLAAEQKAKQQKEDELRASNLASWELEKAASKAQDDLLAAQRIEQQARWRQQLSAARVAVRQLTEVFERLGIAPTEVTPIQAAKINSILELHQKHWSTPTTDQEKLDQINHWLQQAQVHSKQQERTVQSDTPLQVSQMLAYDGRASAGGGAGAVILVISETKDFGSLTGNEVATFLREVIPHLQREKVTGITNTKMRKSAELVPQVFELKLREFDMTPDLRSVLKERSITIAGKKCTWGLESSVAINVRFDLVQQQRLLDMWRICQGAGWTQDQFDMLLTAHIRAALVQCDEELANLLIVAGFQRCGKKDGQTKRFVPADMPPLRALVMTPDARRRMSGLPVALWLGGQGPDNSLLSAHGSFQNIEQDSKSVGIAAAKKRALEGAEAILKLGGDMLTTVDQQAHLAKQVCVEDQDSSAALSKLEPILERMHEAVAKVGLMRDVTADFVQPGLSTALQKARRNQSCRLNPETWEDLIALTRAMRGEMDRRRKVAGELILVQVESFPAVLEIWMRKPEDKKAVMQMSTEAVWVLQQLMVSMGASFLVLEPVTKGLITLEWDHKAGLIMVVQTMQQLRNFDEKLKPEAKMGQPEIFTATGEGAAGGANHKWEHLQLSQHSVNKSHLKGRVELVQKQGTPQHKQVNVKILSMATSVAATSETKALITERVLQVTRALDGFWVSRQWQGTDGNWYPTIVQPAQGQSATKLSELPRSNLEFDIGNIRTMMDSLSADDCEVALSVIGDMVRTDDIRSVEFSKQYVVYLCTPLAIELSDSKDNHEEWINWLSVGSSTSEALRAMAVCHLTKMIRANAAGGVWTPFDVTDPIATPPVVGITADLHEHSKTEGTRWITVAAKKSALVAMGATSNDWSVLKKAVTEILGNKDSQLMAFKGDENTSLILFSNTIYRKGLSDCNAKPGFLLPQMEIDSEASDSFKTFMSHAAQGRGREWRLVDPEVRQARCWQPLSDKSAASALTSKWQNNKDLTLTWQELRDLEQRVQAKIGPFCTLQGLSQGQEAPPVFMVQPQGPGIVFVAASGAGPEVPTMEQVRMEWTKKMAEQLSGPITWLTDLLENEWPELLKGTAAARMIKQMEDEGLAIVTQVKETFVVIFPETTRPVAAIARRESECRTVDWGTQFNKGNADIRKSIHRMVVREDASGELMRTLEKVQNQVRAWSMEAAHDAVEEVLGETMCILPGVRAIHPEHGPLDLQYAGRNVEAIVTGVSDLRSLVQHPAMLDTRSTELVKAGIQMVKPSVVHVGKERTCLLFIPGTSRHVIYSWKDDDIRFQQWNVLGGSSIEELLSLPASSKDDDAHMTAGSAAADPKRKGRAESDDGEGLGTTHVEDAGVMTDGDVETTADGDQAGGARKRQA